MPIADSSRRNFISFTFASRLNIVAIINHLAFGATPMQAAARNTVCRSYTGNWSQNKRDNEVA